MNLTDIKKVPITEASHLAYWIAAGSCDEDGAIALYGDGRAPGERISRGGSVGSVGKRGA